MTSASQPQPTFMPTKCGSILTLSNSTN